MKTNHINKSHAKMCVAAAAEMMMMITLMMMMMMMMMMKIRQGGNMFAQSYKDVTICLWLKYWVVVNSVRKCLLMHATIVSVSINSFATGTKILVMNNADLLLLLLLLMMIVIVIRQCKNISSYQLKGSTVFDAFQRRWLEHVSWPP